MPKYTISYGNKSDNFIKISYTITEITESVISLQLPAWRPGRYELGNFAQYMFPISVVDQHGKAVSYQKTKKDRWKISITDQKEITVSYTYAAQIKNAGGTFKTESSLIVTPVNCLIYAQSRIFESCDIHVDVPEEFQYISAINIADEVKDYFHLAASPIVCSTNIATKVISIEDINFHICFEGNVEPNWEKILNDYELFIRTQLKMFKDFPVSDYYFLNLIFPEKHYHGVEHLESTLIALGPDEKFHEPDFYENLLGISSHELFHFWNVCRIRPLELMPYNYESENYFDTGYIAEGVTTYYGDYLLGRSGAFTEDQLLNELSKTIHRHLSNDGRHSVSVAESSIDLWLDGYKKGVEKRKVSIYAKGAVIAFILDLWIRKETKNQKSLDDVMRLMWQHHGKKAIGYTTSNYQNYIETTVDSSAQWYFDELVYGTEPVEKYLDTLLPNFGMKLHLEDGSNDVLYRKFGIEIKQSENAFILTKVAPSEEHKDLKEGDEILTLDNQKITDSLLNEILDEDYLSIGIRTLLRLVP